MNFHNLHLNDLNELQKLIKGNLFHLKQDRSVDQSSTKKIIKQLYFHYIVNIPLEFFGLEIFVCFVAQKNDGQIIGTIAARRFPLAKSWIIGPVVCHKDFRNRGIASNLMNLILKYLKTKKATSALVSTERNNKKGLMFFEKFGFEYIDQHFLVHEEARKYVRKISVVYGYFIKFPRKILLTNSKRSKYETRQIKKPKMWHILLKNLNN